MKFYVVVSNKHSDEEIINSFIGEFDLILSSSTTLEKAQERLANLKTVIPAENGDSFGCEDCEIREIEIKISKPS